MLNSRVPRIRRPTVGRQDAVLDQVVDAGTRRRGCAGQIHLDRAADGLVILKEGTGLLAYDSLGALVWRREVHLNFDVGGTLDPAGGLLLSHGLASADDGTELWASDIPAHREGDTYFFPGPMVVGDGVLYYMASESQLWAVGDPL